LKNYEKNEGIKVGELIEKYRFWIGGFKKIEETENIKGIGPKFFEKLKDSITI